MQPLSEHAVIGLAHAQGVASTITGMKGNRLTWRGSMPATEVLVAQRGATGEFRPECSHESNEHCQSETYLDCGGGVHNIVVVSVRSRTPSGELPIFLGEIGYAAQCYVKNISSQHSALSIQLAISNWQLAVGPPGYASFLGLAASVTAKPNGHSHAILSRRPLASFVLVSTDPEHKIPFDFAQGRLSSSPHDRCAHPAPLGMTGQL